MTEKEFEISKELGAKIEFKDNKAKIEIEYEGKVGGGGAYAYITADAVVDALCKAIPGTVDDKLGELLKAALKKV